MNFEVRLLSMKDREQVANMCCRCSTTVDDSMRRHFLKRFDDLLYYAHGVQDFCDSDSSGNIVNLSHNMPPLMRLLGLYKGDELLGFGSLLVASSVLHNFESVGYVNDLLFKETSCLNQSSRDILIKALIKKAKQKFGCTKIAMNVKHNEL